MRDMSLKWKFAMRLGVVLPILAAMMFLPAGSLQFWQGWLFLGMSVFFNLFFLAYFYRRDPGLVERRLQNKEKEPEQKRFKALWVPMWITTLVLPGFDYRYGWSERWMGGVPVWLVLAAQALLAVSWMIILGVFRFNSFASATIQVEREQKVISTGPYRIVRHPMYSAIALMSIATPLALGSYVALPVSLLHVPMVVYRLVHEERLLRRDLPGYTEYCTLTGFRLIPGVW